MSLQETQPPFPQPWEPQVLDALSTHIAVLDATGTIVAVNAAWRRFAETNHLDIPAYGVGLSYLQVCEQTRGPEAVEAVALAEGIRNVLHGQCPLFTLEYPCHSADTRRWFSLRVTPCAPGGLARAVVAHDDITTRRQAEEALQAREVQTQAIVQTAVDGIIAITEQGIMMSFNPAAERLFGYSAAEAIGQNVALLIPETERHAHDASLARYLRTGDKHIIGIGREVVAQRKDGSTFPMELAVGEAWMHGKRFFTGIVRDVSARKAMEEALRRDKEFIANLLDTAQTIILVLDTAGHIVRFNPYLEELTGYRLHEVQGKNWFTTFVPPRVRPGIRRVFSEAITGATTHGSVNPIVTRDGRERLIEWYDTVLRDTDGAIVGLLSTGQDITARKCAEEELQRAAHLALLGQLASGVAHEIGTPLNVMSGNAELLRPTLREHGLATAEVDTIIEQGDRITRLIEQLLALGRVESSLDDLFVLTEPLSRALRLLETRFVREAITVVSEIPADLLMMGSADQMEQVFLNLLVNAWHAMPTGGTITIRARQLAANLVRITLSDTGSGMSAEQVARAFEPFYSTKGKQGNGLGLSMCQQIIASHHGTIRLESTLGVGTTVIIDVPIAASSGSAE